MLNFFVDLIVGSVGSIMLIGFLIGGVSWYMVETLIRPKKTNPFAHYTISPFDLGLPVENVTFAPRKGRHLVSGWYLSAPEATATILVCPGYRTRKTQVIPVMNFLWREGWNVLAFEYYGHGAIGGVPVTLGYREKEDFLGALAYAQQRAPQTRIGVLAYSMGAAIAILCGAEHPEIEAIVSDSAFATHTSAVSYNLRRILHLPARPFLWLGDLLLRLRAGYRFRQVEPLRVIARFAPRPLLLIHGGRDSMVDPHDAALLYHTAQDPKALWIVPQANHCGAYFENREEYVHRTVTFFQNHLIHTNETPLPLNREDPSYRLHAQVEPPPLSLPPERAPVEWRRELVQCLVTWEHARAELFLLARMDTATAKEALLLLFDILVRGQSASEVLKHVSERDVDALAAVLKEVECSRSACPLSRALPSENEEREEESLAFSPKVKRLQLGALFEIWWYVRRASSRLVRMALLQPEEVSQQALALVLRVLVGEDVRAVASSVRLQDIPKIVTFLDRALLDNPELPWRGILASSLPPDQEQDSQGDL